MYLNKYVEYSQHLRRFVSQTPFFSCCSSVQLHLPSLLQLARRGLHCSSSIHSSSSSAATRNDQLILAINIDGSRGKHTHLPLDTRLWSAHNPCGIDTSESDPNLWPKYCCYVPDMPYYPPCTPHPPSIRRQYLKRRSINENSKKKAN